LAIGWHFLYEGLSKLETYAATMPPSERWSAEAYLRNASGPLAPFYRDYLLDDPDGVRRLTLSAEDADGVPDTLVQEWEEYLKRFQNHYSLSEKQAQEALGKLDAVKRTAKEWFLAIKKDAVADKDAVTDYLKAVANYRRDEARPLAPFENERHYGEQFRALEKQRAYMLGKIGEWNATYQSELDSLLTNEQRGRGQPEPTWREWKPLDWVNRATVYSLIGMGICLLLGLFTRLAALAAAVFLASLYLAMPPWPGLPGTTALNGHYLFVNFHIIEILAVLAAAGSGRWAGVDAILHAIFSGKRTSQAGPTGGGTALAGRKGV
jgi:uncharacterized membrane protein YphA (DoxX/SURF4 family)